MKGFSFDCYSICPTGWRDDGLFCCHAEYGRGAGYPWKFGDPLNDSGMYRRCERDHSKGNCEKWGQLCIQSVDLDTVLLDVVYVAPKYLIAHLMD